MIINVFLFLFNKKELLKMLKHKDHFHGSDLELIEKMYGIKKEEIVSFSANVNPLGISPKLASDLSLSV